MKTTRLHRRSGNEKSGHLARTVRSLISVCGLLLFANGVRSADAMPVISLQDRERVFETTGEFKQHAWSEARWEGEKEYRDGDAIPHYDLPAAPADGIIAMKVDCDAGWSARRPQFELKAKGPGDPEWSQGSSLKVKKGAQVRLTVFQGRTFSLTEHVYWPSVWQVQIFFQPAGEKAIAGGKISYVKSKSGFVQVIDVTGRSYLAGAGTELRLGDTIKTGKGELAEVVIYGGSVVRLKEGTTLDIPRERQRAPEKVGLIRAIFGKIWCRVESGGDFKVYTPSAVAGVRGTEFTVGYEGDLSTVEVIQGTVAVSPTKLPGQDIDGGHSATVTADGAMKVKPFIPPAKPWWHEAEGLSLFEENFRRLDERRWGKFALWQGDVNSVSLTGGSLLLNGKPTKQWNQAGICTTTPVVKRPVEDDLVLEVTLAPGRFGGQTHLLAGLATQSCLATKWRTSRDPWGFASGILLLFTRTSTEIILQGGAKSGNQVVVSGPPLFARGARLVISHGTKIGETRYVLQDLDGRVLGAHIEKVTRRDREPFPVASRWHVMLYANGYPTGSAYEAAITSVRAGPGQFFRARSKILSGR